MAIENQSPSPAPKGLSVQLSLLEMLAAFGLARVERLSSIDAKNFHDRDVKERVAIGRYLDVGQSLPQ